MNKLRPYLLLALLACTFPALAERPRIGLALSGGGAKGSAHIGVLELLEANNIPVDYIAGTSIGAYVGALYALGYNATEIKIIMDRADFDSGFSDAINRDKLPYRLKNQQDKFNVGLEIGLNNGEIKFPWGVLYGQSMTKVYRRSVGNLPSFYSFDDMAIPFHAIATDLATSEAVVLNGGDLVQAMKASATVPGALVPTQLEGRYLVDGGMAANLPISEVRRMGADIVIAVDISAPLFDLDEIKNAISVLEQISSFLTVHNIRSEREQLQERDIYLQPPVDDIGTADFSRLDEAYDAGKGAAQEKLEELRALSISNAEYLEYRQRKAERLEALIKASKRPVVKIVLDNRSSFNDEFILHKLDLEVDVPITIEELLAATDRVYSLDRFELVDAVFEERDIGRVVVVQVVEKSWGPNYLEFGMGWEDDFTLESVINIDFAYTIGNITDNNGEWRNELGIGTDKSLSSELYLPINTIQTIYQSTLFDFNREDLAVFTGNNRALSLEYTTYRADFGFGYKPDHLRVVETGLSLEHGSFENDALLDDRAHYRSPGVFLRYGYDSLDRRNFPSRGTRLNLGVTWRDEDVDGEPLFGELAKEEVYRTVEYEFDLKSVVSVGDNGFIAQASMAYVDSEIDASVQLARLGGFLNLSGYHRDALIGNRKAFAALIYQYNLGHGLFGITTLPIYLGTSLEAGNVWDANESIEIDEMITAASIYIATDSKLGPVALAAGYSEDGDNSFYFYLGKQI